MVGFPDDNWDTIETTAELLKEIEPDAINVFIMTVYPGTEMYEEAKARGWIITNDWAKYTVHTPVMKPRYLSIDDLETAREYLFNQFRVAHKMRELRARPWNIFRKSSIRGAINTLSSRLKTRKKTKESRDN